MAADELRHAREVLESMGGPASELVSAEALASRFAESGQTFTVAERAFADRTWTYGHVIVDEAQELSPMMWRLLLRRCPTQVVHRGGRHGAGDRCGGVGVLVGGA